MSGSLVVPVIYGPTAVGKTACSIKLTQILGGEIISADSRQFFKELSLGTAKPSLLELEAAPHHFVGHLSITKEYTAGNFANDAEEKIINLIQKGLIPFVVGGSGLYIKALMEGLDELPSDPNKREELNTFFKQEGLLALQERLKKLSENRYHEVDIKNPVRLIRAIEILELYKNDKRPKVKPEIPAKPYKPLYIGLNLPREELYTRINNRVDEMMNQGLLKEVESLIEFRALQSLNTVGYKELFSYLEGEISLDEAIELIKRNSRRFAKRQLTWLRSIPNIEVFHPKEHQKIAEYIRVKRS